jgi:hypothetical protein
MRYDLARARIMLRDLDRIGHEESLAIDLTASTALRPAVRGVCTRLALMRLGVRLALAALTSPGRVCILEIGSVTHGGSSRPLVELYVTEDPLPPPERPSLLRQTTRALVRLVSAPLAAVGLISGDRADHRITTSK